MHLLLPSKTCTLPRNRELLGFLPTPYLDDKIHVALIFITGDRGVWPDDQAAIDSGRDVDVSAWGPYRELHECGLWTSCISLTLWKRREVRKDKNILLPSAGPLSYQAGRSHPFELLAGPLVSAPLEIFLSVSTGP